MLFVWAGMPYLETNPLFKKNCMRRVILISAILNVFEVRVRVVCGCFPIVSEMAVA